MATPTAKASIRIPQRELRKDIQSSERQLSRFAKKTSLTLGSAFKVVGADIFSQATVGGLTSIGKEVLAFDKTLTRVGIQAELTSEQTRSLGGRVTDVANKFGISKSAVLDAGLQLVNLQGISGASADKMATLAKASVATGEQMKSLAGVAFALQNSFNLDDTQLEGALSAVIQAGKSGSVPLGEMSMVLQQLGANFSRMSAEGKAGAADFAALIQVARKGFGSSGEVGTGLKAFIGQLEQNETKLNAMGVTIKKVGSDGHRHFLPFREILGQIDKQGIADKRTFTKLFGSSEARQFLSVLMANRDQFEEIAQAALESDSVNRDAQKFMQSSAGKTERAMARVKARFEAIFTPERLDTFALGMEKVADIIEVVIDRAVTLGAVLGAIKLAQLSAQTFKWATSMQELAKSSKKAAGSLGSVSAMGPKIAKLAGSLMGVTAAFSAGFGVGSELDKALGLSDKIADVKSSETRIQTAQRQVQEAKRNREAIESAKSGLWAGNHPLARAENQLMQRLAMKAEAGTLSAREQDTFEAAIRRRAKLDEDSAFASTTREASKIERSGQSTIAQEKAKQERIRQQRRVETVQGRTQETAQILTRRAIASGSGTITTQDLESYLREQNISPEFGVSPEARQLQGRIQRGQASGQDVTEDTKRLAKVIESERAQYTEQFSAIVAALQQIASKESGITVKVDSRELFSVTENAQTNMRAPLQ